MARVFPYLGLSKKMGCLKLTYHEETDRPIFLGVWKKGGALEKSTDYHIWGDVMREQKWEDLEGKYRYGYQGQFSERDLETDWHHFELREYDDVIGRWTAFDPYRAGASPFIGMGNNPINKVDPDGGCPTGDCPGYVEGESNSDVNLAEAVTVTAPRYFGGGIFDRVTDAWMRKGLNLSTRGRINIGVSPPKTQWAKDFDRVAGAGANLVSSLVALPVVASMSAELITAAPSAASGARHIYTITSSGIQSATMFATEENSAISVIATNGLRGMAYNSAVTLRPFIFSSTASGFGLVGRFGERVHNGLIGFSMKVRVDVYKTFKNSYDTYKNIDKFDNVVDP